MGRRSDLGYESDSIPSAWPSLVWLIAAAVIAVTALMLAPVPA